jgi:hypothetical protein
MSRPFLSSAAETKGAAPAAPAAPRMASATLTGKRRSIDIAAARKFTGIGVDPSPPCLSRRGAAMFCNGQRVDAPIACGGRRRPSVAPPSRLTRAGAEEHSIFPRLSGWRRHPLHVDVAEKSNRPASNQRYRPGAVVRDNHWPAANDAKADVPVFTPPQWP